MSFIDSALLILSAVLAAILLFPLALRLSRVKYLAQALSFPLVLAVIGAVVTVICAGLAVGTGARVWTGTAVIWFVYTVVALVQTLRLGLKNKTTPEEGADLVVMGWNTLGDSVSVEYLRDAILARQPDVVGLPETSWEHQTALVAALKISGYDMRGYTVGPQDGHLPNETSLLVKAGYGEYTVKRLSVLTASTLEATPVDPTQPTFVAVHTVAPTLTNHAAWVTDLKMLAARYEAAANMVLVGDFNATVTHMRQLGGAAERVLGGFADAALTAGVAALGTWPVGKPAVLGTQIDHVLYTGDYKVEDFKVLTEYDNSGSDHRAIVARFKRRHAEVGP